MSGSHHLIPFPGRCQDRKGLARVKCAMHIGLEKGKKNRTEYLNNNSKLKVQTSCILSNQSAFIESRTFFG